MKRAFPRPSAAMVVAIVALIAALVGSAIAGGVITKTKVKKISKNVADAQITARAPGLSVADSARLGGVPASGYTHSDCSSQTGQIKGWAVVNGSPTFSSSFVAVQGYNCASGFGTTGQVVAKRLGVGVYEVMFPNSPAAFVIGSTGVGFVDQHANGPGDLVVGVRNATGTPTDQAFDVLSP